MLVAWPMSYRRRAHLRRRAAPASRRRCADPDVMHALQLTVVMAVAAVVINPSSVSVSRCRWCASGSSADGCCRRSSTSRCRCRRSWSASPCCSSSNGRDGLLGKPLEAAGLQVVFNSPGMILATCFVALPLVIREVVPVLLRDRRRPGAGGAQPRCQRPPAFLVHHPAVHQVGGRVRRGAERGPLAGRVRRGQDRLGQLHRPDPDRYSLLSRSTRTSNSPRRTRPPSCWPSSAWPALSSSPSSDPRSSTHEHRRLRRLQEVRRLRRPRRRQRDHPHRSARPRCSAPPAAASPRCCGSSPGSTPPTAARSGSPAPTRRGCPPRSATSASASSTTPSSST